MKKNKAVLGILLTFILGAVSGALITHISYKSRAMPFFGGRPEARQEMFVDKVSHRLDLDKNQREQVRAIVKETFGEIRSVRRQHRPQIESILAGSQEKISKILKPEQREKFLKIITEHRARWAGED